MPGALAPPRQTLKEDNQAVAQAHPNEFLNLEKKTRLPKTSLKENGRAAPVLFYCSVNAVLSAALIAFNKYLMHEDRFPYPVPLVFIHSSVSSIFVGLFFLFERGCCKGCMGDSSFFSALPQALAESSLKTKLFGVAALLAVQLAFSNAAYMFSSVIFIQMMKEGNLPFVYMLSVMAALEAVHWQRVRVLLFIVFATLMTLKGELNFTWIGFAVQLTGQSFEGLRIVLQGIVLNAKGLNLDVLTYMLLVMPACSLLLGACLIFNTCVWQVSTISIPSWHITMVWGPELLVNALLAVALNFSTAIVVKHASAVGFVLSGIMKDSAIVVAGACLLKESVTSVQVVGFVLQIIGILLYSFIKLYPDTFSDGIHPAFKRAIGTKDCGPCPIDESRYGSTREVCR